MTTSEHVAADPTTKRGSVSPLDGEIDRESPIPIYFQLALLMEDAIREGRWHTGERLPSELGICRRYGLSRTTVRRTLSWLEGEGLIARRKGAGAFVQGIPPRAWLLSSTGGFFEEEALRMGRNVTSQVLRAAVEPLPTWAVSALRLPEGANGATVERIRHIDGHKAIYVVNHVVPDYAEEAIDINDPNESLYLRLRDRCGVESYGGNRSLRAMTASHTLAGILGVADGHPVIYIESVTWDRQERPFDCYRAWVVSEVAPIEISVSAVGARPSVDREV